MAVKSICGTLKSHVALLLILLASVSQGQQNVTDSGDVAALLALLGSTTNHGGRMASWIASNDPCGTANCTESSSGGPFQYPTALPGVHETVSHGNSCHWEGITCRNWRVTGVTLGCSVNDASCSHVQGSLPAALGNLSELSILDVQRNGLIGQLPDELGKLSKLQIVRLGFNKLALLLPRAWSGMKNLRFLDLRSNSLTGTLPLSWNGLATVEAILLDHNALTGFLPSTWGDLEQLELLSLGSTSLGGPIPQSWTNMTSLQVLDIGDACGICGTLPVFPQSTVGRPQVESTGSSLGWNCQRGQCGNNFPISIVAQAVICVSIVCGLILLCLLRRLIQHYYPNALLIYPIASRTMRRQPVAAASQQAARETELARAAEEGRRRGKAKPGSLVINPDGYTYSYAVKIEASSEGSTGRHSRTSSQTLEGVGAEGSTSRHTENGSQSQENSITEGSAAGHLRGSSQILEEAEMGQPSAGNSNSGGACDSRAGDAQSAFAHYSTAAGQGGETRESSVGRSGPSEGAFAEAQPSVSALPKPRVCSRSSRSRTDGKSEVALASRLQYDSHAEVSGSQESISSIAQQQPPQRHM